ncbi:hypothetical protein K388_07061 [Streptomyces sp. KhCrAH-43]|nr:hypothetical protein K388_07061 [Streptomyces sp. KhCrAH-43]
MTCLAVVDGDAGGWCIDREALTDAIRARWSEVEIDSMHRSEVRSLIWQFKTQNGPGEAHLHRGGPWLYMDVWEKDAIWLAIVSRGLTPMNLDLVFCDESYTFDVRLRMGTTEAELTDLVKCCGLISVRRCELEGQDGLDDVRDPGRRAAEFAEEAPVLESGDGLLDQCTDLRVGPVDSLPPMESCPIGGSKGDGSCACTLGVLVCPAGDVGLGECGDDAMLACGPDIVGFTSQGWRSPHQTPLRIGYDLQVHAVLLVFARVERAIGDDPVDGQERPAQERVRLRRRRSHGFGEEWGRGRPGG